VRVASGASPVMGRAMLGAVDYSDAPGMVDLARQALRWLHGELASKRKQ
jgi:hypothetical protein